MKMVTFKLILPSDVISNRITIGARAQTSTQICSCCSVLVSLFGNDIISIISFVKFFFLNYCRSIIVNCCII